MMIRRFLATLRATSRPLHARRLREVYGDTIVHALVAERILVDAGLASWYPCGGHCHQRRAVIEESDKRSLPFVAPCAIDHGCDDAHLSQDDLRMLAMDFARLLDVLRRLLRIDPSAHVAEVIDDVVFVGALRPAAGVAQGAGLRPDVFLALAPDEEALAFFLASRTAARRETVVLFADARLASTRAARVSGTARVHAIALEDVLSIDAGRLVARDLDVLLRPPAAAGAAVAVLLSHEGERALTKDEYEAIVESAPELFDLFLDASRVHNAGKKRYHVGGTRTASGYESTKLTEGQAKAVADFIRLARPVAAEAARRGGPREWTDAKRQLLKTGWKLVDDSRSFIVRGDDDHEFRPPPGARWALILPTA
jgi:hypothetical protein